MIHEFYANEAETNFADDLIVPVQGKQVCFDPPLINVYNGLPNFNNEVYTERANKEGQDWYADTCMMAICHNGSL